MLGPTQEQTLAILAARADATASEIAAAIGYKSAQATSNALRRLARRGLVTKTAPRNGVTTYQLTDAGRATLAA